VFGKGVVYDCPNEMLMQQKKFVRHSYLYQTDHELESDFQIKGGLSTEALSSYPKMIDTECAQFFSGELKLGSSNPGPKTVEIFKTMSSLIILTAARTLQGKEVRESMDSRFAERMHHLDGGFTPVNFLFPNLPLPSYKRRDKAQKEMSDFYVNIMKKRDEGESEVSLPAVCREKRLWLMNSTEET
jgi:sterol 14-demethylase